MSTGLSNPKRSAAIAGAIAVASAAALAWGALTIATPDGEESIPAGVATAIGLFGVIFAPFLLANFLWAVRIEERLRRGEGVIAHWVVDAEALDRFRIEDRRRAEAGEANDWILPRVSPPLGVQVVFAEDSALVGDALFGLASSGLTLIRSIDYEPGDPPSLRFLTASPTVRGGASNRTLVTQIGVLRIPVDAGADEAVRTVMTHYRAVLTGERLVKPEFWTLRIRIGLATVALCAVLLTVGLGAAALRIDIGFEPAILIGVGAIFGVAGVVLTWAAWGFRRRQRGERQA